MFKSDSVGGPFTALVGIASLLAALLYVAGFSYRWSYFYNFGVQHVVFKQSVQSFLVAALELFRGWRAASLLALWVGVPLLVLNGVLHLILRSQASGRRSMVWIGAASRGLGLQSRVVVDSLRAAVIVYGTYHVASALGYETFREHARMRPDHPLPAVTAVMASGKDGEDLGPLLRCGAEEAPTAFIGNGQRLREYCSFLRGCNRSEEVAWRLLYRDNDEIYLFATEAPASPDQRPLTIVLPNRGNVALMME
jgi:hypothetical protein